jgi:hypothetical protein
MNGLSWLLYFAEVSENISGTLGFISLITAAAFIMVTVFTVIPEKRDMTDTWIDQGPKLRKLLMVTFFLSLIGLLFPSQNTVYLIIASESAEMVVTSENGQRMIGDIQQIVSLKLENIADDITGNNNNNNNQNN